MELQTLNRQHEQELMELFCDCFYEDHVYGELFPDPGTRREKMRQAFLPSIRFCLEQGDCRGIRQENRLVAFLLCFDYKTARKKTPDNFRRIFAGDRERLPYEKSLHEVVEALPGPVLYGLSVAVAPELRGRGLGSALIDLAIRSHPNCWFASDVSNTASLPLYTSRGFEIRPLDEDYHLVLHDPGTPAHSFCPEETVPVLVPSLSLLTENGISFRELGRQAALAGYEAAEDHGIACFRENPGKIAAGQAAELDYDGYLALQRLLNVSQYREEFSGNRVFYVQLQPYEAPPLMNDLLRQMLPSRQAEWSLIPDVFVSVPVLYRSRERITQEAAPARDKAAYLLKALDFRTRYEAGVPSSLEDVDDLAGFKRRIRRYYLGKLRLQITSEVSLEDESREGEPIGAGALADLYVSVDTESRCGVLTWFSQSAPFLLSQLMDNIIRNSLMVVDDGGNRQNFYDFINEKFDITKRGTPKIFSVIPRDRSCLQPGQLASLLAAETIYPEGESFGQIIDPEILDAVTSEKGMGQYDRAFVCAYSNVVLQFCPEFRATLRDRLGEESITLFYIELILLEEAAIHIADREITRLFASRLIAKPVDFLEQVGDIYDEYSKTVDFWDIQVNYPTSQLSIDMLRRAFRIRQQLEFMQRDQAQLQTVFDTKCDIIDRNDSRRMDTSLAIISVLAVFSAWMDGHDYLATWTDVFSGSAIHILQRVLFCLVLLTAIYAVTHLLGGRISLFLRTRREKNRRRRRKK